MSRFRSRFDPRVGTDYLGLVGGHPPPRLRRLGCQVGLQGRHRGRRMQWLMRLSAIENGEIGAPRTNSVAILLRHYAGGLSYVTEVMGHPRRE